MTREPSCRPLVRNGLDLWHPSGHEAPEQRAKRIRDAKSVCAICPVRAACAAAVTSDDHGIWGGQTLDEREPTACAERRGTTAGVMRHRRAREPLCVDCTLAKREASVVERAKRRAAA